VIPANAISLNVITAHHEDVAGNLRRRLFSL